MQEKPLFTDHKELIDEFDFNKNSQIQITDLPSNSSKKVWWKCSVCNDSWEASIGRRCVRGSGCPTCAGQRVHSDGRNSMARTHPKISEEFHLEKNKPLTPETLLAGTHKRLWWACAVCDHHWQTSGSKRVRYGGGCPVCSNRHGTIHRDGRNSMEQTHPELALDFHPTRNSTYSPGNLVAGTRTRIWWLCSTCEHEWIATGDSRSKGAGCPFCAKKAVHSDGRNSLSRVRPEIAKEFHPSKNDPSILGKLTESSNRKVWWLCSVCSHEWRVSVDNRTKRNCPSCSGQSVHSSGYNSMATTHPKLALEFSLELNKKTPDDYIAGTGTKLWWQCSVCDHTWKTTGASRSAGTGCGYCNTGALHSDQRNSLANTHPDISEEFHPTKNGKLDANKLVAGSNKRIWWLCSVADCLFEWRTAVSHRTNELHPTGCPKCAKSGFQEDRPAYYYVIEIRDELEEIIFFKGGITCDISRRLNQHKSHFRNNEYSKGWKLELVKSRFFKFGRDAKNLEQRLLESSIRAQNISGVSNELFSENPLEYAQENNLL